MIDLHIHTCASDGTDDTRSLLERLRQAGIKTFAVSDHDTVDGISSIEPLVPEDMMFIRGMYIKPCQTNDIRLDAREAIETILAAGGIPVWAHPYGGYGKRDMDDEEFNKQLHILMDAGLQGLECYYSAFDQEQVEKLLATAQKHKLLVSGGSDYHGDRKNIQLGTLNAYGKIVTEEELTIVDALKQRQNR